MHPPSLRAVIALWAKHALTIATGDGAVETNQADSGSTVPGDAVPHQVALVTAQGDVATLSVWSSVDLPAPDELATRFARSGTPVGVCPLDRVDAPASPHALGTIARGPQAAVRIDARSTWFTRAPHPLPRPGMAGQLAFSIPPPPAGGGVYVIDDQPFAAKFRVDGLAMNTALSITDTARLLAPVAMADDPHPRPATIAHLRARVDCLDANAAVLHLEPDLTIVHDGAPVRARLVWHHGRAGIVTGPHAGPQPQGPIAASRLGSDGPHRQR